MSDAFTISTLSSRIRKIAMISSVTLPNVALIEPSQARADVERELLGGPPYQSGERQDRPGGRKEDREVGPTRHLEDDRDRNEDQEPVE